MIIGDNYGQMDTKSDENSGMGEYGGGDSCIHQFEDGLCVWCGELEENVCPKADICPKE